MKRRLTLLVLTFFLSHTLVATEPTIALVLSGGGARGLAHIAVIEALEEYGIPIDIVVGTSMGALVGSFYAAGYSPQELLEVASQPSFLTLIMDTSFSAEPSIIKAFEPPHNNVFSLGFSKTGVGSSPSMLGDQMIMEMLSSAFSKLPDDIDFDDLEIPFRAIGADVLTGDRIVYEKGSLITAVRSSISIPIIFAPYLQPDGSYAIDGGIVDNLPIDLAKELGYDIIIACDVNAFEHSTEEVLSSLSSMVKQTMTLVTQIGAKAQHKDADLLIIPQLSSVMALDFHKHEQILEAGRIAVESEREQFEALAERIAQKRPLAPQQPDRKGVYLQKSDPIIASIRVVDFSQRPVEAMPTEAHFASFLGQPLDETTKQGLQHSLTQMKKNFRLSTATYSMATINEGEGELVVFIQSSTKSDSNISLGLSGSTGLSNNSPNAVGWITSDARLNAYFSHVRDSDFSLKVLATMGQSTSLGIAAYYPFYASPASSLDINFSLTYKGGAFTPLNSMINGQREIARDKGFDVGLGLELLFKDYGRLDFGGEVALVFLHGTSWQESMFPLPSLYASLVWDTQVSRFAHEGVRGEFLTKIGVYDSVVFALKGAWEQRFALSRTSTLGYNVHLTMMRMPFPLLSSYSDLGGLYGFSGYSVGTLRRDIALGGLFYQLQIEGLLGFNAFFHVGVDAGISDTYSPYTGVPYPEGYWLSSSTEATAGIKVGLGLEAPLGDITLQVGVNLLGMISVSLGII